MKLTQEQLDIIAAAKTGESLIVEALAGTGKSSTCREIAKVVPKLALYVAYNKSIADEAAKSFPANVTCKTMHSIAWGAIVRDTKYRGKLKGFLDRREVSAVGDPLFWKKKSKKEVAHLVEDVIAIVTQFCSSPFETLRELPSAESYREEAFIIADLFWGDMIDKDTPTTIDHSTYLKLYQLSKPKLNYGLVLADEAQDLNPCVLDILKNQDPSNVQIVYVGDPRQSIYMFNGAVNAFEELPATTTRLPLTQSFRFTPEVAATALKVLRAGGYTGSLTGAGTGDTFSRPPSILARTNSDLFTRALQAAEEGYKVYVVGGMKELFNQLYSVNSLKFGDMDKIYDKRIATFRSWDEFSTACNTQLDLGKLRTILRMNSSIHQAITTIKGTLVTDVKDADVMLSTIHKSKGLSLGDVEVSEGVLPTTEEFLEMDREAQLEELLRSQILNLVYIAITRSSGTVGLPDDIVEFFNLGDLDEPV